MRPESVHSPETYLHVDIRQAATDMIESVGVMSANHLSDKRWAFEDIERAAQKAARSVAAYKSALLHGKERLTRNEYDAGCVG